jgi:hypothetical protein
MQVIVSVVGVVVVGFPSFAIVGRAVQIFNQTAVNNVKMITDYGVCKVQQEWNFIGRK